MSDPIRELEIAKEKLTSLRTELATMAELNASQHEILHTVAVERDALALELSHLRPEWQAMQAERDAAVSALRLATNSTPGKPTTVLMTLDKWTLHLAEVEHFGADQWRNGNAGREPQEYQEWRQAQPRE